MHILGLSGSLRTDSFNTAALRACQSLLPSGVTLEAFDIAPSQPFDGKPIALIDFEPAGNLTDSATRDHVTKMLIALVEWTQRVVQKKMS